MLVFLLPKATLEMIPPNSLHSWAGFSVALCYWLVWGALLCGRSLLWWFYMCFVQAALSSYLASGGVAENNDNLYVVMASMYGITIGFYLGHLVTTPQRAKINRFLVGFPPGTRNK
jgi:hypothetical protein